MRYIKLYEAFESDLLSKTIKFLNKDAVKDFKRSLYAICNIYDFPYSKLSDDMFEYLRYSKAIELNVSNEAKDCKQESSTVKGEFCKNGSIKRTWGKGFRVTVCPNCKGTGKEPVTNNLSKVKFWFDVDGNHIVNTGCDGTKKTSLSVDGSFSRDKNDYNVTSFIDNFADFSKVKSGYMYVDDFAGRRNMVLYIHNIDNSIFMFQDQITAGRNTESIINGISKEVTCVSEEYFNGHFRTSGRRGCELLKPKRATKNIVTVDEKVVNDKNINIGGYAVTANRGFINPRVLKDAHFALILDINNLRGVDYEKVSNTKNTRNAYRKGAYALMKDKDIKAANISRYVNKIIELSKVDSNELENIKNIKRTIFRVLGGGNILYNIHHSSSNNAERNIDEVTKYLYKLIISARDNSDNVSNYISYTNSAIRSSINGTTKCSEFLSRKMAQVRDTASKNGTEGEVVLDKLNIINEFSRFLYDLIKDREISTLEDLEIMVQDIGYLSSVINGGRISLELLSDYFTYATGSGWSERDPYNYLVNVNIDKLRSSVNSIKIIAERRLK